MVSHFEGNIKYIKSEIRVGCIAKHKILAPQLMANKKFGLAFILSHFLKKCITPQCNYRVVLVVNAINAMIALTWHIIFSHLKL